MHTSPQVDVLPCRLPVVWRTAPEMATVFDLEVQDLPEGWTPLEAVTVVTCLNEMGETTAVLRITNGLMSWEVIGLVEVAKHETLNGNQWDDD